MFPIKGKVAIIPVVLIMLVFDYSHLPVQAQTNQLGFFPNQLGFSPFQSEAGILQGNDGFFGELRVVKIVADLSNLNLNLEPSDFSFRITFNNGSAARDFSFPESGVVRLFIGQGVQYSITEPVLPLSNIRTVGSIGCSGTLVGGEFEQCTIRNEIVGAPTSEAGFIDPLENITSEAGVIEGIESPTPGDVVQPAKKITSESGTIIEPPTSNAPFKQCVAPSVDPVKEGENPKTGAQFVVPSSATYTIAGKTPINELISSAQLDNSLVIKIYNDQKSNDGITFGTASPRFIGTIAVGTNEIDPVDLFKFYINDIDSTCDFVTLVKPISQKADEAFSPLGNTSEVNPNDFDFQLGAKIPDNHIKSELLAYCIVGRSDRGEVSGACPAGAGAEAAAFNTDVINPPFRTCQNAFQTPASVTNPSNFDVYVIKGSIDSQTLTNLISNDNSRNFAIQIVADNVLTNQDQIKIVDSNNPFLTIYFIIDAGKSDAEIIPFKISRVSTECTDVGFAAKPQIN